MGWTGVHRPKGMSDREFFEQEFPAALGQYGQIVACATKARVFYAAVRNNDVHPAEPGRTWALVVLVQRQRDGYCVYKDMRESSGPGACDAPAAVLDALSPTDNEYAVEWRSRCRAKLAKTAGRPKVKAGDLVRFATPLRYPGGLVLDELRFVSHNTFTAEGHPGRYRITRWREREHTVVDVRAREADNAEAATLFSRIVLGK